MYSMFKRVTVFALALLTLVMGVVVPYRRAEAAVLYNNVTATNLECYVDSNGRIHAVIAASGIKGKTTCICVELYIEKRILGLFWSKIDLGYPNNIWIDSTTSQTYYNEFIKNLPSAGTFRTTVTITVSGTGGADDIIVLSDTVDY